MKKYLLNALMLSVALLFGTSAQAQITESDATVKFTIIDKSNPDVAVGEITEGVVGYNKIANGEVALGNEGWNVNKIGYVQVDASQVEGTIIKASISMDVSGSTDSKRGTNWGVGYNSSVWSAELTWNTADRTITTLGDLQGSNGKSATTFITRTFDISKAFEGDEDKIVTILIYETAAAGGNVKNISAKVTGAVGTPVNYTFKFLNVADDSEIKAEEVRIGVVNQEIGIDEEFKKSFTLDETKWIFDHSDVDEPQALGESAEANVFNVYYHAAATYHYSVVAVDEEGNSLGDIEEKDVLEGDTYTYYYPTFWLKDGTLLQSTINDKSYLGTVPATENGTIEVVYKASSYKNIVYYSEAENIEGFTATNAGNIPIRCSNGKGGYATETTTITSLTAGNYKLFGFAWGNSGTDFNFFAGEDKIATFTTAASTVSVGSSNVFTLSSETDITMQAAGGAGNSPKVIDFLFIQDLGAEHTYKVTAKSEDGKINKKLAEGKGYANDASLSIPYARYINVKGTLYEAAAENKSYNHSFNLAEDRDEVITYKPTNITEVALFTEGEDIEGITKTTKDNIAIRASQSAAGYAADGEVTVGTIATGGTYKMVAQLAGSGRNGETTFAFAANGTTVFEPVLGAKSNLGSGTSERFSVQDGATITLAQGGDANSAVDYVYVYKVEDFNIAEDAEYFAKSTEQNPNDGVLSNHLIGKDGSTLEVTSDKENAGAIWEDTWQEEVDGNMVDKSFVDLRIQKDGAFIISTSSNSLSLRKIVFTGAALQMTPSDGQFEGQAASRVNKAAPAMVTKTWTGNIDKVKFWADSLVRISTIKLYVEASDGNTATYEDKPRPDQPAKPALEVAANIAAFKALADSTEAKLTLTDAVVTFVNGKNIYLEDATGAIVLYDMGLEVTEGQKLNGLLAGKTVNYFALPEMVKTDSTKTDTFTAEAGEVKATTMALADICKVENLARLITISNVTIDVVDNNIFATSGDEKLQVYNKFKVDGLDLQKGNVYTSITGILVPWQNKETLEITYELAPRTLADLVLDADATGISELAGEKAAREVYNLNGQRVNATKKGLYIINGKKVMVK